MKNSQVNTSEKHYGGGTAKVTSSHNDNGYTQVDYSATFGPKAILNCIIVPVVLEL